MSAVRRKSAQKPRICRRCEGHPYLSNCIHSAIGKKKIAAQSNVNHLNIQPDLGAALTPNSLYSTPASFGRDTLESGIPPFTPTSSNLLSGPGESQSTEFSSSTPRLPLLYQSLLSQQVSGTPFMMSTVVNSPFGSTQSSQSDLPLIDPALETQSNATNQRGDNPFSTTEGAATPNESNQGTPTTGRERASKKNPVFGKVKGAYRGSEPLEIIKQRDYRPAILDRAQCTQRFSKKTRDLIEKCDELAQETSCWLFFSAQHINANEAFLHYSSPRLVKEGRKEVEDLTNDFNKLYINLMAARQRNAAEMSKKLQAAEEKQASTSKALDEAAQELETARKDAAEEKKRLEEQIEYYKTLLKP
ncbi:hypothetical protein B0H13DRAFT_1869607 [Mycena leptocephala]|nr:hypothetical protein B0H13DRAFT_1906216 [Mycena leptocephala]KAJ7918121.1 hypothetical protein B0H13DRAFT_1869607 [Mycena leptocephala]